MDWVTISRKQQVRATATIEFLPEVSIAGYPLSNRRDVTVAIQQLLHGASSSVLDVSAELAKVSDALIGLALYSVFQADCVRGGRIFGVLTNSSSEHPTISPIISLRCMNLSVRSSISSVFTDNIWRYCISTIDSVLIMR